MNHVSDSHERRELARAARREKKQKPTMKMTGKGMKRFAVPKKPIRTD